MKKLTQIALPLALAASGLLFSASRSGADEAADARLIAHQRVFYPLTTCVVSGEELGEKAQDVVRDGRLVRFCCEGCIPKYDANPDEFNAKLDAAVIRAQKPGYALKKCVVSGEELGSMGDPIAMVQGNELIMLCCKGCVKSLKRDPQGVMAKRDAAMIEAKVASYPVDKCLVSGEPLGDKPVNMMYGTELVRFCCNDCVKGFERKPHAFLSKLRAAGGHGEMKGHGDMEDHGEMHGHGAGRGSGR